VLPCDACGHDGSSAHICTPQAWAAETNRLLKRLIGTAGAGKQEG
jgi:hypothetical protein